MEELPREYRGAELARLIAHRRVTAPTSRWLEHAYGATHVPASPRRAVTIGPDEHELLLHIGVVPVLVNDSWGEQPHGVWPWARHLLGGAQPETFGPAELPFDRIRALHPDVIVATWASLDEGTYDALSAIAPTVPNRDAANPWAQAWDEHFTDLAAAFGMGPVAQTLVDGVRLRLMSIAEAHPHWQRLVAASITIPDDVVTVDIEHQRGALLADLGFRLPDDLRGRAALVDRDQIGLIDRDLLIWVNGSDDPSIVVDLPHRTALAAHRQGREVYLDKVHTAAFSVQTPLSLHFLLDMLVPEIEAAVDGELHPPVTSSARYGVAPGPPLFGQVNNSRS